MTHPNEDVLRRGYAAFAEGDMDTLRELIADDTVWHVPGDHPLSDDYKGKDEVFGFFDQQLERTDGTFRIELHDVLANDEHAVALVRFYGQRKGRDLDGALVTHVFHVEDGQATEFWASPFDQAAADEFWS